MNLYCITISLSKYNEKAKVPGSMPNLTLTELHTFKIPAEDLDAALIALELDVQKIFPVPHGWAVTYVYAEPMKTIPNPN